jgi:hypothetical protein
MPPSSAPVTAAGAQAAAITPVAVLDPPSKKASSAHDYKGFVAGVFSGVAKLTGERTLFVYRHIIKEEQH